MSKVGYAKFTVGETHYVYDTTTNAIVRLSEAAWHILDDYLQAGSSQVLGTRGPQNTREELEAAVQFLDAAKQKRGMFQPFFRKTFAGLLDRAKIERAISSELAALGLNLTDACNQRCKNCVYSGLYSGERTHGSERMTWRTAKRCIDYYLARASDDKPPSITFYGGEPFLNWEVLRQCASYIRRERDSDHPELRAATNLTLLTEDKLDFLVSHDVGLQVSLDGPREVHDHVRVFPNGGGTHEEVLGKLALIRAKYPQYFRTSVSLACAVDRTRDPSVIINYFCEHELLRDLAVTFGALRESDIDGIIVPQHVRELQEDRLDRILSEYSCETELPHGAAYHRTMQNLFSSVFGQLTDRHLGQGTANPPPNSVCIPGAAHLFAASNGSFYTCEKFSISGHEIGDCERGIDIEKVHSLLNTYIGYCNELCQECWAYRLCTQCFLHSMEGDRISMEQKRRNCVHTRRNIKLTLQRFTYLWDNEPKSVQNQTFSLHHVVRAARRSR